MAATDTRFSDAELDRLHEYGVEFQGLSLSTGVTKEALAMTCAAFTPRLIDELRAARTALRQYADRENWGLAVYGVDETECQAWFGDVVVNGAAREAHEDAPWLIARAALPD